MTGSEAVWHAREFLQQAHRDIEALMRSVDADVDGRAWGSVHKNRISEDLSNALSSEWWTINYVMRIYVPRGEPGEVTSVVAFSVVLQPEGHKYSVAFSVGARLSPAVSREALWKQWRDARPLLRHLAENRSGGAVPIQVLRDGFSPSAASGVAFVAPLLELENMANVRERLLDPAFGAIL